MLVPIIKPLPCFNPLVHVSPHSQRMLALVSAPSGHGSKGRVTCLICVGSIKVQQVERKKPQPAFTPIQNPRKALILLALEQ